ncbi:MAG: cytochrome c-type biogenesis protein CcmH [Chloroflexi bacterium]|nr:cytochrome c-type biogenesis protein CcmH [Chloroflexota bacterium]
MFGIRWGTVVGIVAIGLPLFFLSQACAQLPLTLEERARALDKRIICPVCPGETIDQTQAEIGKQMRALVREKLAEGWSDQQVLDFFAERYGPSILAQPPRQGFPLLAWLGPPLGLLLAVVVLGLVLRAMRRSAATLQPEPLPRPEELTTYLSVVDRELQAGSESPEKKGQRHQSPGPGRRQ